MSVKGETAVLLVNGVEKEVTALTRSKSGLDNGKVFLLSEGSKKPSAQVRQN